MELFASNLRERATELGLSHAEIARRSGLTERRYSHYVNGIREPDLVTLVRIAEVLQTTPNDLLGVGTKGRPSARALLIDRLTSAAQCLSDHDLDGVAIQTEALADRRSKKR